MQNKAPKPEKFRQMMSLFTKLNLQGRRHAWAFEYSQGRTESTKELYADEVTAIIKGLEVYFKEQDVANQMRRKIIAKAHLMQWEVKGGKADMERIDKWCINNGPYKKELNKHTVKELGILVSVFDKVYKQYMNKV